MKLGISETYEEWLEEFIAINANPKIKMVGIPITRREYYQTYFPKTLDPRKIYEQYKRLDDERLTANKK